jgi:RNA-directed DNA polymerase
MQSVTSFLETRLKLKINAVKSTVARPWKRKFLGYSMTFHKKPRLKVAPESVKRFRKQMGTYFRKGRGKSLKQTLEFLEPLLRGWANYFSFAEVKSHFEELDMWLRRKLRRNLWKQWKTPRTRFAKLRQQGLSEAHARQSAGNGRGPWWNADAAHMHLAVPNKFLKSQGLVLLLEIVQTLQKKRTAEYGTVCSVV